MKQWILAFGLILLSVIISTQTVQADMGPKPSLTVTIKGVDEPYSLDLLTDNGRIDDVDPEWLELDWYYDTSGYPNQFIDYQDEDGLSSYFLYDTPSSIDQISAHVYDMTYIAPDDFRVILYMKDTNSIILSERIQTDAFDASITWDLTGVLVSQSATNVGTITGTISSNPFSVTHWYITGLRALGRVIITLMIELGILFLFQVKRRQAFLHVGIVNVITQLTLSVLVISAWLSGGPFFYIIALFMLEFVVFIVEFIVYVKLLGKDLTPGLILLYSVIANAGSFGFSIVALLFL